MWIPFAAERDWLALVVATYGAAVATGVAAVQIVRDRPGVKLVLTPTNVHYEADRSYRDFLGVRVVNHRKRPITLRSGGVLDEKGRTTQPRIVDLNAPDGRRNPFPRTLTDGEGFEFYVPLPTLGNDLPEAWVEDELGRMFKSRPSRNPLRRWKEWRIRRKFEKVVRERSDKPRV